MTAQSVENQDDIMALGIEALGYTASAFVGISICMADMKRLRWFNTLGSFLFVLYGIYKPTYPVMLVNGMVVWINLYHLWRMRRANHPIHK